MDEISILAHAHIPEQQEGRSIMASRSPTLLLLRFGNFLKTPNPSISCVVLNKEPILQHVSGLPKGSRFSGTSTCVSRGLHQPLLEVSRVGRGPFEICEGFSDLASRLSADRLSLRDNGKEHGSYHLGSRAWEQLPCTVLQRYVCVFFLEITPEGLHL